MKILVFGGRGLIGSRFIELNSQFFEFSAPSSKEVDISNINEIENAFKSFDPAVVINFAAYTNVEESENQKGDEEGICFRVNASGAKNIAQICKVTGKHLVHISTEYVFDGSKESGAYSEEDTPNPINWYGQTKYYGEEFVRGSGCSFLIARLSMPYSANYEFKKDLARFFFEQLKSGNSIKAIEDQNITPIFADDIANALKVLIDNNSSGIYNLSSKNSLTPLDFVKKIAEIFDLNNQLISPIKFEEYNKSKRAKLLKNSWLNSGKFAKEFGDNILHTVEEDLALFKSQTKELTD